MGSKPIDALIPHSSSKNDDEHGVWSLSDESASVPRLHSLRSTSSPVTDQGEDCTCRDEVVEVDEGSDPKTFSARTLKLSSIDFEDLILYLCKNFTTLRLLCNHNPLSYRKRRRQKAPPPEFFNSCYFSWSFLVWAR